MSRTLQQIQDDNHQAWLNYANNLPYSLSYKDYEFLRRHWIHAYNLGQLKALAETNETTRQILGYVDDHS